MVEIKDILKPYKTNSKKTRLGRKQDGGYVINEIPNIKYDALYSYGSDNLIEFEREFYAKFGVNSYTYDHTINGITNKPDYVSFFKEGVSGVPNPNLPTNTIESHIIRNNHQDCSNLFMQMDIEGSEWETLLFSKFSVLHKFSQIVIELHLDNVYLKIVLEVLKKLNQIFVCTHVHGNNNPIHPWVDINFPQVIEVTYVRRDLVEIYDVDMDIYPSELDYPNRVGYPDLPLDWWKHTYSVMPPE
jgi:hypothetical protein